MYNMYLSNKKALIVKVKALELNANSTFLLVIIVNKEIAKTKTSFLTVSDIRLNNDLFYCSCNILYYSSS